jgi:hypothetical protein
MSTTNRAMNDRALSGLPFVVRRADRERSSRQPVSNHASRSRARGLLAVAMALSALLSASAFAQPPLPADDVHRHLGPATCASSVCHGRANADDSTPVLQNEYRTWTREDPHSRAYALLLNDASKAMARRLGIGEAHEAKVCLDCHTDNVPPERRGEQFQLSDGVGCEACHGGAGQWIRSHVEAGASHADNLAKGLFPLPDPAQRARLCLTCHLGTAEKFAGHDMMAAGHPRLSFELAAFTANQPAHFVVDADYVQRKGEVSTARLWAEGLIGSVRAQLALIASPRFDGHGLFPEIGFFDCHSCHHPMDDVRWTPLALQRGLAPGALRLNDGNLALLIAFAQAVAPSRATGLLQAGNALHRASQDSRAAVRQRAAALASEVDALQAELAGARFAPEQLASLRRALLQRAAAGEFRDFAAAEQAFLAVETLSLELEDEGALRPRLNRWFASVRDEHRFDHRRFAAEAGRVAEGLR